MKKTTVAVGCILLIVGFLVRFIYVNTHYEKLDIQRYDKGAVVPIGTNFFWSSTENMSGYTVRVSDSWIEPLDGFLAKMDATPDTVEIECEKLYMVKVEFQNIENTMGEQAGINLHEYMLLGTDYGITINSEAYKLANPNMQGLTFSLKPNKPPLELVLPFAIYESYVKAEHVSLDAPALEICSYPTMKLLSVS